MHVSAPLLTVATILVHISNVCPTFIKMAPGIDDVNTHLPLRSRTCVNEQCHYYERCHREADYFIKLNSVSYDLALIRKTELWFGLDYTIR